jgi:hypothetical protein
MVGAFLSHSSKDKPFVRDLAAPWEPGGEIKIWLDEREIAEWSSMRLVRLQPPGRPGRHHRHQPLPQPGSYSRGSCSTTYRASTPFSITPAGITLHVGMCRVSSYSATSPSSASKWPFDMVVVELEVELDLLSRLHSFRSALLLPLTQSRPGPLPSTLPGSKPRSQRRRGFGVHLLTGQKSSQATSAVHTHS